MSKWMSGMPLCGGHVQLWGAWSIARHARLEHGMAGSRRMCFHIRSSPKSSTLLLPVPTLRRCKVISQGNPVCRGVILDTPRPHALTQDLCITLTQYHTLYAILYPSEELCLGIPNPQFLCRNFEHHTGEDIRQSA